MKDIDLTKILKEGQEVYSPIFGYGTVVSTSYHPDENEAYSYPIYISFPKENRDNTTTDEECVVFKETFTKEGKYVYIASEDAECVLFPSKSERDWSKYMPKKCKHDFKPFEMVLCRNSNNEKWIAGLFSHYSKDIDNQDMFVTVGDCYYYCCIPYEGNEHLLGTNRAELQ